MIVKLYSGYNPPKLLSEIASSLRDGAVMIYPTDTGYALGCCAMSSHAIQRICELKRIEAERSHFSIICYDLSEISKYARFDNSVFKLMKRTLPSAVTFILPGSNLLPKIFRKRKTLGIRMPNCDIDMSLVEALGMPLITSSLPMPEDEDDAAYLSDPELIAEKWENKVDLIIDGGVIPRAESTIVDCTGSAPEITRQGITNVDL